MLAVSAPTTVPQRAMETVRPRPPGVSWKALVNALVAPAITAVSKPKRRPPSAATTVLLMRVEFSAMRPPRPEARRYARWDCDKYARQEPSRPARRRDCRVRAVQHRNRFLGEAASRRCSRSVSATALGGSSGTGLPVASRLRRAGSVRERECRPRWPAPTQDSALPKSRQGDP